MQVAALKIDMLRLRVGVQQRIKNLYGYCSSVQFKSRQLCRNLINKSYNSNKNASSQDQLTMTNDNPSLPTNETVEQFLTFELAGEMYGVEILKVQEIRGWEPIRKIPKTPSYIKGALNLRGAIVPILDLRERFDIAAAEYSPVTVVIVINVKTPTGSMVMGVVADAVSDVLDIKYADIKKAPDLGSTIDTRYMRGMYVAKQGMIMLLDADKLLNHDELDQIGGLL